MKKEKVVHTITLLALLAACNYMTLAMTKWNVGWLLLLANLMSIRTIWITSKQYNR